MTFLLSIRGARLRFWVFAGVAALLIGGALLPAQSQPMPNAEPAPPPPPPPVTFQNLIPPAQETFLQSYVGKPARELLKDKQYKTLAKLAIPNTMYHYGYDMSLDNAVANALDGSTMPVTLRDGRYLMISGSNGRYLAGRGFMWFDLQNGVVLGVFYFHPSNGEPTPTLTVFSKQLTETDLSMSQLPPPFSEDLANWASHARTPAVTPRYFIPANGKKYPLLHDEDYCWHPENQPAPDPKLCQQLNVEAADVDVNAAYFMKEVHNAANGTAWMLGPDQVAWIGFRESTCGMGLGCRIRVTRERTRVLIGRR